MSKRVLCKFFAHGKCLKGENCKFSHDSNDPPSNVCPFYQKGICSYGSRCRYEHVKASQSPFSASSSSKNSCQNLFLGSVPVSHPSRAVSAGLSPVPGVSADLSASSRPSFPSTERALSQNPGYHNLLDGGDYGEPSSISAADSSICSFAAVANPPHEENHPHIDGNLCPSCRKHCLHSFTPAKEREEHIKTCEKKEKHLKAIKHSKEIECSICFEHVLSKATAAERKFGLLPECDHPFCISCIMNWRSSSPAPGMDANSTLRACPICRKRSYFVIPSVIWYLTKEDKQEIIDSYKAKLRSIDCKHFDFGNGMCPFGISCFYKHTVNPGSHLWNATLMPELYRSSYLDVDDTDYCSYDGDDTGYGSNVEEMESLLDLFECLYSPDISLEQEPMENYGGEDELSMGDMMAFALMQQAFDTGDSSGDEDSSFD